MWSLSTRESLNKSEETETSIWEAYGNSFWLREIKSHSITFIGKLDYLVDIPIGYVGSNINEGLKTVMLVIEKLLLSVTFSILAPNCSIPLLPSLKPVK